MKKLKFIVRSNSLDFQESCVGTYTTGCGEAALCVRLDRKLGFSLETSEKTHKRHSTRIIKLS